PNFPPPPPPAATAGNGSERGWAPPKPPGVPAAVPPPPIQGRTSQGEGSPDDQVLVPIDLAEPTNPSLAPASAPATASLPDLASIGEGDDVTAEHSLEVVEEYPLHGSGEAQAAAPPPPPAPSASRATSVANEPEGDLEIQYVSTSPKEAVDAPELALPPQI